jgi:peroxiredoxin
MRAMWLLVIVACASPRPVPAPPAEPPTAQQIVARVRAVYRHAKTYVDRGEITAVSIVQGRHTTVRRPFATAFVRGGRYRFEYREEGDRQRAHVVWSDGARTLVTWFRFKWPELTTMDHLADGVGDASLALTGGVPHITASMLGVEHLNLWSALDGLVIEGSDVIDGRPCWRLAAYPSKSYSVAVWIDRESYALRRIFERKRTDAIGRRPEVVDEIATAFAPVLDGPVDPVALAAPSGPMWIGVRVDDGGRITRIAKRSPGDRAGLQLGDRILSLDGRALAGRGELTGKPDGAAAAITLERDGVALTVDVVVAPRPKWIGHHALMGKPAPDFAAAQLAGPFSTTLADHKGQVVVVAFFATWCEACTDSIPRLNALLAKHAASGLRIVGLSGEDPALIKKLVADHGERYAIGHDPGDRIAWTYQRASLPMFVVINRSGVSRGVTTELDEVEAAVRLALSERP